MAKEEWGAKRFCPDPECGARFYDLMRDPIICPKCGKPLAVDPHDSQQDKEFEPVAKEVHTPKKVPREMEDEDDILTEDGDGVDLDDDVLDESDDDTVPLDDIANVATDDS